MIDTAEGDPPTESTIRALLGFAAAGDLEAVSQLYDILATETYTVCSRYLAKAEHRDEAMHTIWRYIWANARLLCEGTPSARGRILRWAATCSREYVIARQTSVTLAS